jgi:cellulose synthase/poly-beta-1,6-N-acetylglucosamine synthase-like glycosyltransferase
MLFTIASYTFLSVTVLLGLLVLLLFVQTVAACFFSQTELASSLDSLPRPMLSAIIPAHNEGDGILTTIQDIRTQLGPRDRLLVVAHNCQDNTAAIAGAAGAEVIELTDPTKVGKGYALDYAIRHLSQEPPDIVISIDADCHVGDGAIDHLARTCRATGHPVQALDLMVAPGGAPIQYQVAEFAWRVKNWVRPLGYKALGLPCNLMGTGMAFPWQLIHSAKLAHGSLVEDLALGLDLAKAGSPALFCPLACVTSLFPSSAEGSKNQRRRWEEGHIRLIFSAVPRLIWDSVLAKNFNLLALAFDALIPPLSLLTMLIGALFLITGSAALAGMSVAPFYLSASSLVAFTLTIAISWWRFGRDVVPISSTPAIVSYLVAKLILYGQMLRVRTSSWVRTERETNPTAQMSEKIASGQVISSKKPDALQNNDDARGGLNSVDRN